MIKKKKNEKKKQSNQQQKQSSILTHIHIFNAQYIIYSLWNSNEDIFPMRNIFLVVAMCVSSSGCFFLQIIVYWRKYHKFSFKLQISNIPYWLFFQLLKIINWDIFYWTFHLNSLSILNWTKWNSCRVSSRIVCAFYQT